MVPGSIFFRGFVNFTERDDFVKCERIIVFEDKEGVDFGGNCIFIQ
jgi:hypothetical protein